MNEEAKGRFPRQQANLNGRSGQTRTPPRILLGFNSQPTETILGTRARYQVARAVLRHGFKMLGLAEPTNVASQRVLEKSGLKYERNAHYDEHLVRYHPIGRTEIDRIPL